MTTRRRPAGRVPNPAKLLDELDSPEWLERSQGPRSGSGGAGTGGGSAPVNVRLLQHIANCDNAVSGFIARAREAAGDESAPMPADRSSAYQEAMRRAAELGVDWQTYMAAMAWRNSVESELYMGNTMVVRREPCPECRTVGLVWVSSISRASCINRHCAAGTEDGAPRSWTVAQLAVARERRVPLKAAR
ncbi:hypothetical protein [Kitasatospora sp. NPDC087315]|uniref:hypothetical protein n=1 Tax=Kitasatospora sp. NPDC087315 TaxID=3364069 RepID=UPI003806D70F